MSTTLTAETVGPVDVSVIRFDGNQFNGEVAPALKQLQDDGTVRIIDLTFVRKDDDGSVSVIEATDAALAANFERLTDDQFDLLSDEDLQLVASDLEAGSSAMVVVWENAWMARLASALRGSQAEVLMTERIPRDVVLQAIAALND